MTGAPRPRSSVSGNSIRLIGADADHPQPALEATQRPLRSTICEWPNTALKLERLFAS